MLSPKPHEKEHLRLRALQSFNLLDTLPEKEFDEITALASSICGTPISLVSLVDENRQWFKSKQGLDVPETPRDVAFCSHALHHDPSEVMMVKDSRQDPRFHDNPLVTGDPHVIFYAGAPLFTSEGLPLGTLCVIDNKPNQLTEDQVKCLKTLSNQVVRLFELRRNEHMLKMNLKALETTNEQLDRFSSTAAHDIKSPLNNISTLIEVLKEAHGDNLQPEIQETITLIAYCSDKLVKLVNGILTYAKSDRFLQEHFTQVDLVSSIDEVAQLIGKGSKFQLTIEADINFVNTNPTALEQIVLNLLSNAIHHSDKEMPEICVSIKEVGDKIFFYVSDNGPGIPEHRLGKIFDLFESFMDSTSPENNHGIGLSIVQRMVVSLGGEISVSSELNKGTTFQFYLPRIPDPTLS